MISTYPDYWLTSPVIVKDFIEDYEVYDNRKSAFTKCLENIDAKEYPYQIGRTDFKTLADAEAYAKRLAAEEHEDVVIKQRVSVVRFPLPDLKVESLVLS